VPPPANQPIRTNKRTAECLECGRLFRLGLAVQVVSVSIKSFHPRALTLFHLSAASLIVFPKPIIPFIHSLGLARGGQRASSDSRFDLSTAITEHFIGVVDGPSVNVVQVPWEKIEHMPKFMQESEHLSW
jgi:hypothetical protein